MDLRPPATPLTWIEFWSRDTSSGTPIPPIPAIPTIPTEATVSKGLWGPAGCARRTRRAAGAFPGDLDSQREPLVRRTPSVSLWETYLILPPPDCLALAEVAAAAGDGGDGGDAGVAGVAVAGGDDGETGAILVATFCSSDCDLTKSTVLCASG